MVSTSQQPTEQSTSSSQQGVAYYVIKTLLSASRAFIHLTWALAGIIAIICVLVAVFNYVAAEKMSTILAEANYQGEPNCPIYLQSSVRKVADGEDSSLLGLNLTSSSGIVTFPGHITDYVRYSAGLSDMQEGDVIELLVRFHSDKNQPLSITQTGWSLNQFDSNAIDDSVMVEPIPGETHWLVYSRNDAAVTNGQNELQVIPRDSTVVLNNQTSPDMQKIDDPCLVQRFRIVDEGSWPDLRKGILLLNGSCTVQNP